MRMALTISLGILGRQLLVKSALCLRRAELQPLAWTFGRHLDIGILCNGEPVLDSGQRRQKEGRLFWGFRWLLRFIPLLMADMSYVVVSSRKKDIPE